MKIALAHDHLFQLGGAELVLHELANIYSSAEIYTLICNNKNLTKFSDRTIRTSLLQKLPGGVSHFKWYLNLMPAAWEQFDFSEYDIVISSSSAFVKGIVTPSSTLHICYCHTPTRYIWSDRAEYIGSLKLPGPLKLYLQSTLEKLQKWDKMAASRVDHFVANSNFIADRIKKYYNKESTVIYPPVDLKNFHTSREIGNYFLIVSRLRPYKKVGLAIEAFNQLKIPLVVIGGGEEMKSLKASAKKNITFLGEVPDQVRNKYLARCKAFIHPQIEDFGLSAVEAMASGRPVIAFRGGGALETINEGLTGEFFDEQTWESLAYAVLHFNPSNFDPDIIKAHAEQFNVDSFRERFEELVNRLKD